jgi:tungstate transport system ATP-binding protein
MAETLLELKDIAVRHGDIAALRVPRLSVEHGEVLAVIGPNGAGKSTLLRVMGLLERAAEGEVRFHGRAVAESDALALRRRMASVFQEPLLLNASVYDNATLGLKLRGFDRRSIEQRVLPWLDRLGITHLVKRPARSLSGGEAQRTSLARALALDPELLLLDEPFSALDPPTRDGLLLDLERILRETGITTVFVTHDRDEAAMLGDRIAVLIDGTLLQVGAAAEVFAQPINESVAGFVGIETRIPGVVETVSEGLARVELDGRAIEVVGDFRIGERVIVCLRPEDVTIGPVNGDGVKTSARNRLTATVTKINPWGFHYRVALDCGGTRLVALVTRPSFVDLGLREGEEVMASFKATAVHVIRRK